MSSPVSVNCKIISLAILEKAAIDCGYSVEREKTGNSELVNKLNINTGGSYGWIKAELAKNGEIKVTCDSMVKAKFQKNLLARYNMYQIKENWEATGDYIFDQDWLTVRKDETLELNCQRRVQ